MGLTSDSPASTWTKADIARMQYAIDFVRGHYMRHARPGRYDAALAWLRSNAHALVRAYLRETASAIASRHEREQRAYLRIAARLESEPLPREVVLPGESAEPLEIATPREVDTTPTPMWTHPLVVRVDERLAYPVQAATREGRFVVVREWRAWGSEADGPTKYDAPRESWHTWAAGVAANLGAAQGWATVADGVPDGHPASEHVQRILAEAARTCEPPAGVVALDLRGLGLRTVEVFVRALVAAADQRLARDGWVRCGVLLHDSAQVAAYLNRCVRLYADPGGDAS